MLGVALYDASFAHFPRNFAQIKGMAKPHIMFLGGGDELVPEVESLAVLPRDDGDETGARTLLYCVI